MYDECAILRWSRASESGSARLELPQLLRWSLHRAETDPILGWYSSGLGRRVPAITLLGQGRSPRDEPLITRLEFLDVGTTTERFLYAPEITRLAAMPLVTEVPGNMEAG